MLNDYAKKMLRLTTYFLILTVLAVLLCGCGQKPSATEITLSENGATVTGPQKASVKTDADSVTITRDGNYDITGTGNWSIIVQVQSGKAVYLNLKGVDITCDYSAPINVKKSSFVVINLAENSQNFLTDRHLYVEGAAETDASDKADAIPDAAISSRAPLLLQGSGKLSIQADCYNGIATNDTFTMKSGNVVIHAAHHGIKGKDFVVISGGRLNISCDGDGIKSTNTEAPDLGYVNVTGGTIDIHSDDEGIYAAASVTVSGGDLTIESKKTALYGNGAVQLKAGSIDIRTGHEPILGKSVDCSAEVLISVNGRPYRK